LVVWQKPAAQREAARRFLAVRDKSNQIALVAYYSWFAISRAASKRCASLGRGPV
jgi:hypothetical protein